METIDLAALGTLSSSTKAVLNKDQKITQLIGQDHAFIDLSKAIEGKANFENSKRHDLVKVLKTDYANFGIDHTQSSTRVWEAKTRSRKSSRAKITVLAAVVEWKLLLIRCVM
mgnify:CR=1 FL=1